MSLWVERCHGEWRIATEVDERGDDQRVDYVAEGPARDLLAMDSVVRIGTGSQSERVTISPRLADRPVVTRPIRPFYVAAGEQVSVFVGSPLWLHIGHEAPDRTLHELPIVRPSDTWFGDDTMVGELCYASRTQCRLRLEELPARPHRAMTRVQVQNNSKASLLLERMKLPVQYLPLFHDADGMFWTRDITVIHEAADTPAAVRHRDQPPALARSPELMVAARIASGENLAIKVFSSLFR